MRLSCLARNGRSPGEESLSAAVAAQAIEAQPSFGQIKPWRGRWSRANSILGRRRGGHRMSCTRGRPLRRRKRNRGVEKGGTACPDPGQHMRPHRRIVSRRAETPAWSRSKRCSDRSRSSVDDQSTAPVTPTFDDDEWRGLSPVLARDASR